MCTSAATGVRLRIVSHLLCKKVRPLQIALGDSETEDKLPLKADLHLTWIPASAKFAFSLFMKCGCKPTKAGSIEHYLGVNELGSCSKSDFRAGAKPTPVIWLY